MGAGMFKRPWPKLTKVFLVLFLQKKNCLLPAFRLPKLSDA
jgi:hypothetical protein